MLDLVMGPVFRISVFVLCLLITLRSESILVHAKPSQVPLLYRMAVFMLFCAAASVGVWILFYKHTPGWGELLISGGIYMLLRADRRSPCPLHARRQGDPQIPA